MSLVLIGHCSVQYPQESVVTLTALALFPLWPLRMLCQLMLCQWWGFERPVDSACRQNVTDHCQNIYGRRVTLLSAFFVCFCFHQTPMAKPRGCVKSKVQVFIFLLLIMFFSILPPPPPPPHLPTTILLPTPSSNWFGFLIGSFCDFVCGSLFLNWCTHSLVVWVKFRHWVNEFHVGNKSDKNTAVFVLFCLVTVDRWKLWAGCGQVQYMSLSVVCHSHTQ